MTLKNSCAAVALALALVGCQKKETVPPPTPPAATAQPAATGNPLTAPVDYLGAVAGAKRMAEKTIDLAALNNAIQLFYAQEDRFPKDLSELVAKRYIAALPAAPAGMRMAYNPASGELKIVKQ